MALAAPRNGITEIAGPERGPLNEIVARYLNATGDPRQIVCNSEAQYWGGRVEERSLVPLGEASSAAWLWTNGSVAHKEPRRRITRKPSRFVEEMDEGEDKVVAVAMDDIDVEAEPDDTLLPGEEEEMTGDL